MEKLYGLSFRGSRLAHQYPMTKEEILGNLETSIKCNSSVSSSDYQVYELVPVQLKSVVKLEIV